MNLFNRSTDAKTMNEAVKRSLSSIKVSLSGLNDELKDLSEKSKDPYVQAQFFMKVCDEVMSIKGEVQNISKQLRRKVSMMKEDKLVLSKIETKSNNLKVLGEDVVNYMHNLTAVLDNLHQNLTLMKRVFLYK